MMVKQTNKARNFAEILIGSGILFVGMTFMSVESMLPLREYEGFRNALIFFGDNMFMGILMGFMLTLVSKFFRIYRDIIALASQGILLLASALPILYGDNIGTCTTALISSIGATRMHNVRQLKILCSMSSERCCFLWY